jgi:single-strand DNA-binding protein
MASVNKVILVGNLGKDPEVRFTPGGKAVCKFPLATTERWSNGEGQQERTEWHNIVVWGRSAENCGQYLAKGRQIYLEGSLRSRSYDDKEGNKRYVTEIIAQRVQFLGGKPNGAAESDIGSESESVSGTGPSGDDEVPF